VGWWAGQEKSRLNRGKTRRDLQAAHKEAFEVAVSGGFPQNKLGGPAVKRHNGAMVALLNPI
jgi:hypothetical protein